MQVIGDVPPKGLWFTGMLWDLGQLATGHPIVVTVKRIN